MAATQINKKVRTLYVPIAEKDYKKFMEDSQYARSWLQNWLNNESEVPYMVNSLGFCLNGKVV